MSDSNYIQKDSDTSVNEANNNNNAPDDDVYSTEIGPLAEAAPEGEDAGRGPVGARAIVAGRDSTTHRGAAAGRGTAREEDALESGQFWQGGRGSSIWYIKLCNQ